MNPTKNTKLDLTPEQIAALEREKQELLRSIGAKNAAIRATPEARARAVEEEALPPRTTVTVEEAARTEDEIQARLRQINAEIDGLRREEIRRKQQAARDGVAAKRLLGQEQAAAAEQALEAKLAAAVASTDAFLAELGEHRRANADLAAGGLAQKQAAVRQQLQPLIDQARATRQAMRIIRREFEELLQALAVTTWKELDPTWPLRIRTKFQADVSRKADEILRLIGMVEALSPSYSSAGDLIMTAEAAIQAGGLPGQMADLRMNLANGGSPDHIAYIRGEIAKVIERRDVLSEQGKMQAGPPATIRVDLTGTERLERKRDLLTKNLTSTTQQTATMGSVFDAPANA